MKRDTRTTKRRLFRIRVLPDGHRHGTDSSTELLHHRVHVVQFGTGQLQFARYGIVPNFGTLELSLELPLALVNALQNPLGVPEQFAL